MGHPVKVKDVGSTPALPASLGGRLQETPTFDTREIHVRCTPETAI